MVVPDSKTLSASTPNSAVSQLECESERANCPYRYCFWVTFCDLQDFSHAQRTYTVSVVSRNEEKISKFSSIFHTVSHVEDAARLVSDLHTASIKPSSSSSSFALSLYTFTPGGCECGMPHRRAVVWSWTSAVSNHPPTMLDLPHFSASWRPRGASPK